MTMKEILKIASDEKLMFFMNCINESVKNDFNRTVNEVKTEEKNRKIMVKKK